VIEVTLVTKYVTLRYVAL